MNVPEFIAKWRKVELKERSAAQEHFLDLCSVFNHPTPATADPTGESFCFEKGAAKHGGGDGFADVWKRGFWGWEYKGKHKDLAEAYDQLLRYREAIENPPLLLVCDLDRIVIHTNFTATVAATYDIPLEALAEPRNIEIMRAVFHNPEALRPGRTSTAVTQDAARHFAKIASAMRERGLDPAAVAHFLDRIVFCLFAEDTGLLPKMVFSRIVETAAGDPARFGKLLGQLFDTMATGGDFGLEPIRHFNGNLFDDRTVLDLTTDDVKRIAAAANLDWSAVDPSIFGTLFERGLDPARTKLACDRAAELFAKLAGGRALRGVSVYESQNLAPLSVKLPIAKIASVTGRAYQAAELADVWNRLDFAYDYADGVFTVHVPTRRPDVRTYQDLIEEAVRISGYQLIPTTLHAAAFNGHLTDTQKARRLIRNTLSSLGLDEVVTYSLVAPDVATAFDLDQQPAVRLLHPMTEERSVLRHSLVPSLLGVLEYNRKRKAEDVRLFELGKRYSLSEEVELVSGVLTGNCQESTWQGKTDPFDFFAVKGILEALFAALSVKNVRYVKPARIGSMLHPGVTAELVAGTRKIGILGKLHPNESSLRDLPDTFVFELEFAALLAASAPQLIMKEIARFPAVRRDLAVVVDRAVEAQAIVDSLVKAGKPTLSDVAVFDLYEGEGIEAGKKSIALALTFQDYAKTLETAEIDAAVARLLKALSRDTGAALRS